MEGFHGGFNQTIHLEMQLGSLSWIEQNMYLTFISTQEVQAPRNTTIMGLQPGAMYHVRLFASNERGISGLSEVWNFTTKGTLRYKDVEMLQIEQV